MLDCAIPIASSMSWLILAEPCMAERERGTLPENILGTWLSTTSVQLYFFFRALSEAIRVPASALLSSDCPRAVMLSINTTFT